MGIFAIEPLENKIREELKMPLLLLYGDHDWLRYPSLEDDIRRWREESGVKVSLKIVKEAGHHLYIDNPSEFNDTMINWFKDVELKKTKL